MYVQHAFLGLFDRDFAHSGYQIIFSVDQSLMIFRLLTPYVLQRVNELTQGKSLKANVALVLNNAKVGGF